MQNVTICWFPEQDGKYKVVQLYVKDEPVLVFQNRDRQFHRQMLEMILRKYRITPEIGQIPGDDPHDPDHKPVPLLEGHEYRVVGMGLASLNQKELLFFGDSYRYRIPINEEHARLFAEEIKKIRPNLEILINGA